MGCRGCRGGQLVLSSRIIIVVGGVSVQDSVVCKKVTSSRVVIRYCDATAPATKFANGNTGQSWGAKTTAQWLYDLLRHRDTEFEDEISTTTVTESTGLESAPAVKATESGGGALQWAQGPGWGHRLRFARACSRGWQRWRRGQMVNSNATLDLLLLLQLLLHDSTVAVVCSCFIFISISISNLKSRQIYISNSNSNVKCRSQSQPGPHHAAPPRTASWAAMQHPAPRPCDCTGRHTGAARHGRSFGRRPW